MTQKRLAKTWFLPALVYAGGLVALPGVVRADNIIPVNNSFETPNVATGVAYDPTGVGVGWTFAGATGPIGTGYINAPPDGIQAGIIQVFSNAPATPVISQTLTGFTVGDTYAVTFYIAQMPTVPGAITAYPTVNVGVTMGTNDLGTYVPGTSTWVMVTTPSFVATDTSYTLTFTAQDLTIPSGWNEIASLIDLVEVHDLTDAGAGFATINFDSLPNGTVISNQYSAQNAIFSGPLQATGNTWGGQVSAPSPPNYAQLFYNTASNVTITFQNGPTPVVTDSVSFDTPGLLAGAGNYFSGETVNALDVFGNVISTQIIAPVGPSQAATPYITSFNVSGIHALQFIQIPHFGMNGIDDLQFETPYAPGSTAGFSDVPATATYYNAANLMLAAGVTTGCVQSTDPAVRQFCPNNNVTRQEMAAFIVRAVTGEVTPTIYNTTPYFSDVPSTSPFFPHIQKLMDLNITTGCGGGKFCPADTIPRWEMAMFMIRARLALYGATFSSASAPDFTDVPTSVEGNGMPFPFIQRSFEEHITNGCGGGDYCPDQLVTRGQMASFIMRGLFNETMVLAADAPMLTGVSPNAVPQAAGSQIAVTIAGANTNFQAGDNVSAPSGMLTVSDIVVDSATSIAATLTVNSGAVAGPQALVVTTGGQNITLPLAIKVGIY